VIVSEANPEKFSSRMYNKLFYGVRGGIELLDRKWKGLSDHVTLECDGKDLTQRIKDLKVHAILFLNIPSYGGGTRPWNKSAGNNSTDDGLIEVIGLTIMQIVSVFVFILNIILDPTVFKQLFTYLPAVLRFTCRN